MKRWAFLAVSRDGAALAARCAKAVTPEIDAAVFTLEKYAAPPARPFPGGKLSAFWPQAMAGYDVLVCVMAAGIVVRGVAPYLKHKSVDPAVLVLDAKGQYVISLLSGHLGGANAAARLLAGRIGAAPVITTGTDVAGAIAVDTLAEQIGCTFTDFTAAKNVTAAILDRQKTVVVNEAGCDLSGVALPECLTLSENDGAKYRIVISERDDWKLDPACEVQLIPRDIVLGIGCRKHTPADLISGKIAALLKAHHIHPRALAVFATIGLKAHEQGLIAAAEQFGAAVEIVADDAIRKVQDRFDGSDFVERVTGLRGVSEPAGYTVSHYGTCVAPVVKGDGVTLSLWRRANSINK
ncbi:cobalt-precorrin 5A hydrolase [uncultured Pseudoramibacter sp.]|uniref:cobalt-precorrin 5A hydrolase n=1 Tax=uncultured Pseudoramibacter sp. TaxID=1623493 RepID=UPI0025E527C0|nr:cobalamin biosynthesis protein [uncultured Pseudoramibacter sp.]